MQKPQKKPAKASLLKVFKAVSWAFLGVREQRGYDTDVATISPLQAIIVALISALLFVLCILSVVMYVTR